MHRTIEGTFDVDFKKIDRPLKKAFDYIAAQVEHLPASVPRKRWPRSGQIPDIARGFILSTRQLYGGALALIADRRPTQLVLPAGVIARALVEGVGNLMAILEDPEVATPAFARDDFLNAYRRLAYQEKRWGEPRAAETAKLRAYGLAAGLTSEEMADPEGKLQQWPTPRRLLRRNLAPSLAGERRTVFEELYGFWYASLSAMSHHRMTALQLATFTEDRPNEDTFTRAKSATAVLAVVTALCVLSEIETFFEMRASVDLRIAWELTRPIDDVTIALCETRYARLLGLTQEAAGDKGAV